MTEWEKEREKEEFIRASKMYKPLAGMIASRFTRAKFEDTIETVDVALDEGVKDYVNSAMTTQNKTNINCTSCTRKKYCNFIILLLD